MSSTGFFWALPFVFQGLAIFIDEFYFHHRRPLPTWELIGHPLDTLTVMACFIWIVVQPPTATHLAIYVGLALFSCFFVTKDEFVHKEKCSAGEQWLHSVLFIMHPLVLSLLALYWYAGPLNLLSASELNTFQNMVHIQLLIISIFFLYQIIYGGLQWNKSR